MELALNVLLLWVVILSASLALFVYLQCLRSARLDGRITNLVASTASRLAGKADKRPTRPRACYVTALFHERDQEGREIWLCTKCGAVVPMKGHTVAACEKFQADVARAEQEQIENAITD